MHVSNEVKKFYDEATYRKLHGFIYTNNRVEYAWQTLSNLLQHSEPKTILEIGCGIGEICHRLAGDFPACKVIGHDISEKSIEIATDLFVLPNLSYVRSDSLYEITLSEKQRFDVILMMDVYEHIPVAARKEVHGFIQQHLAENGLIFLSCPTPQHLDFLKKNKPTEIQPVDEDLFVPDLLKLAEDTGTRLIFYHEVCVWQAGDYFHAALSNRLAMQAFSDYEEKGTEAQAPGNLKNQVVMKVKEKILGGRKNNGIDKITRNKELLKRQLGEDLFNKVLAYKA